MKNIAISIISLLLSATVLMAQSGQSAYKNVNVSNTPKPTSPPILEITDLVISDSKGDNNNVLDANEHGQISFLLTNKGKGDSYRLEITVNEESNIKGLTYTKEIKLDGLAPNKTKKVTIPISTTVNLESGTAKFKIGVTEANHFDADPIEVSIKTQSLKNPQLVITDYSFSNKDGEKQIKLGSVVNLKVVVQNQGMSNASDVIVLFTNPENVFPGGQIEYKFAEIKPKESITINYEFFTNKIYSEKDVPIKVDVSEVFDKYGTNKVMTVSLDKPTLKNPKDKK